MANIWGRTHFQVRARENKTWYQVVAAKVGRNKPKAPLTEYYLYLERHSSQEPDYDGLVLSFKPIVDGLVNCGVLADDKISMSGPWEVQWIKAPQKKGKMRIKVLSQVSV